LGELRDVGVAAAKRWTLRWTMSGSIALTLLELLWELVLAPLPGGRWLALKALPLALVLPALARGARKARQWVAVLTPWYFAEALVRALTEPGRHALVAGMAATVAALTFAAVLQSFRAECRAA
ncbi:MAG: DUF2069 domain-containing protein, partial [Betaproteobacteria bacterium]|nr:DUF2069 domain-containing protein [Betaproteobacteria bacterium]